MDKNHHIKKGGLRLQQSKKTDSALVKKESDTFAELPYRDIGEVAALSQLYFPGSRMALYEDLKQAVDEIYFKNGVLRPNAFPIVSRSEEGLINGFLGVLTNTFLFNERVITVANCHHLMATEEARAHLIPMKLLQQFLSGPQDLSFADGSSESTRLLWKRLGGEPAIGESIYYKIPLRPLSFLLRPSLSQIKSPLDKVLKIAAVSLDNAVGFLRLPLFYRKKIGVQFKPLTAGMLLEGLDKIRSIYSVFPQYDRAKLEHLIHLLDDEKRYGDFQRVMITDYKENLIGWFLYYAKKGGSCEVIQAVSVPGKEEVLFDALTHHAYSRGGVELSGRLMSHMMRTPFTTKSVCIPARMWTLFHSNDPRLMLEIQSGKTFITRLEGDLWVL